MRGINYILTVICAAGSLFAASPSEAMTLPVGAIVPWDKGCGTLTPEEQRFANHLCPAHREAFCSQFTPGQRRKAMKMNERYSWTPNQAVHRIMVSNSMPINGRCDADTGCSQLASKDQNFAMHLCSPHREVFCSRFTPAQRKRAMNLVKKNSMMTPDQAVQRIMQDTGMVSGSMMSTSRTMTIPPSNSEPAPQRKCTSCSRYN